MRFARREAASSSLTRERFREQAYAIRDLIQKATGYLFKSVLFHLFYLLKMISLRLFFGTCLCFQLRG